MDDPERAFARATAYYRAQGYAKEWDDARIRSLATRDAVTDEWREGGAEEGHEFAILTDTLSSALRVSSWPTLGKGW
jgi:hypothetical protein